MPAGARDEATAVRRRAPGDGHGTQQPRLRARDAGSYDDAELAYRDALAINRKLLGDIHPNRDQPDQHRFRRLRDGRDEDAIETLRQSLEMSREVLGPEHPDVGGARREPGLLAHRGGRVRGGRSWSTKPSRSARKALGPEASPGRRHRYDQGALMLGRAATRRRTSSPRGPPLTDRGLPAGSWQIGRR